MTLRLFGRSVLCRMFDSGCIFHLSLAEVPMDSISRTYGMQANVPWGLIMIAVCRHSYSTLYQEAGGALLMLL